MRLLCLCLSGCCVLSGKVCSVEQRKEMISFGSRDILKLVGICEGIELKKVLIVEFHSNENIYYLAFVSHGLVIFLVWPIVVISLLSFSFSWKLDFFSQPCVVVLSVIDNK